MNSIVLPALNSYDNSIFLYAMFYHSCGGGGAT
uniref:Uncharacterized protein n=1 Tax=Arundo donax TaxID=35708 RepID=A0A0A8YQ95_ARUDO